MPKVVEATSLLARSLLARNLLAPSLLAPSLLAPSPAKRLVYKPPCGPNPQGGFVLNNKARLSGGLLLSTSGRLPSYRMAAAS